MAVAKWLVVYPSLFKYPSRLSDFLVKHNFFILVVIILY